MGFLRLYFSRKKMSYRVYLLVVVAAAAVEDDVEVASGECEVLNVPL